MDNERKRKVTEITRKNIPNSNILVAKSLLVMAAIAFLVWILFALGFLKSKGIFVNFSLIVTPLLFAGSSIWCLVRKGKGKAFPFLFFTMLAVFWLELELMSGYKSKLLLPILILLSLRYYNKKVTLFTYICSLVALLGSIICNAYLYTETGFIDLNIVSLDKVYDVKLSGFIYNNIIDLHPSSNSLVINGLVLNFLPNFIFLSALTFFAIRFMRYNLNNIIVAEDYAAREANHRAELIDLKSKVLLSQIKPHFIYNTLTTISYFCNEDPQKADQLTTRFSEYLRNNLSSLSNVDAIPFSKELNAIKNYLEIEKMRFEDRVNVEYDIKCDNFMVPVLAIQPIVENAVKHGICKKEDGGTIKISSFEDNEFNYIKIEDDGVGFDENDVDFDGIEHVGVKNIITRIENYGGIISIESKVGIGTTVDITLPKEKSIC